MITIESVQNGWLVINHLDCDHVIKEVFEYDFDEPSQLDAFKRLLERVQNAVGFDWATIIVKDSTADDDEVKSESVQSCEDGCVNGKIN